VTGGAATGVGVGDGDALPIGAGFCDWLGSGDVPLLPPPQPENDATITLAAKTQRKTRARTIRILQPHEARMLRSRKAFQEMRLRPRYQ
jgi:uncharacterized protein YjlB